MAHPGIIQNALSLRNPYAPSPDFDYDADAADLQATTTADLLSLGNVRREQPMESKNKSSVFFSTSITIILSSLIFLIVIAWFDFIQTAFFQVIDPGSTAEEDAPAWLKFWYALFSSVYIGVLIILCYIYGYT
jgi:hypothetical protein